MSTTPASSRRGRQRKPRPAHHSFSALGVDERIVRILQRQGITTPRPIQADTIAAALRGRDVCGRAPTGSGKTLAFAIPVASATPGRGRPTAMILAPTRELALQITEVLRPLVAPAGLRLRALIGGTTIGKDIRALERGVDVVVGCPGRMLDLLRRNALDLSQVSLVVLDEADRMADMGFLPDVTRLLDACDGPERQTLLFSATLDDTTATLERRYLREPVRVDVGSATTAIGSVSHTWEVVARPERRRRTAALLADHDSAIVFTRTKRGADRLARQLTTDGHAAVQIHGDRSQSQRSRALSRFADGQASVLVATDIAARGIHVDGVSLVLHFDLPPSAEDYTHRSGRTGRAGADGTAVAWVCEDQTDAARDLLKTLAVAPQVVGDLAARPASRPSSPPRQHRTGRQSRGRHHHRNGSRRSR